MRSVKKPGLFKTRGGSYSYLGLSIYVKNGILLDCPFKWSLVTQYVGVNCYIQRSRFRPKNDIYSPPPSFWKLYFFPSCDIFVFRLPSWLFCLNSSLFCIFLKPFYFPFSHFLPVSSFFVPLSSFFFHIFPLFPSLFHIFFPKCHRLMLPPPPGGGSIFQYIGPWLYIWLILGGRAYERQTIRWRSASYYLKYCSVGDLVGFRPDPDPISKDRPD